jgi:hypothetical protein
VRQHTRNYSLRQKPELITWQRHARLNGQGVQLQGQNGWFDYSTRHFKGAPISQEMVGKEICLTLVQTAMGEFIQSWDSHTAHPRPQTVPDAPTHPPTALTPSTERLQDAPAPTKVEPHDLLLRREYARQVRIARLALVRDAIQAIQTSGEPATADKVKAFARDLLPFVLGRE